MLGNAQHFSRYIGIDYSGAETPTSRLTGLRIYSATPESPPAEVPPPPDLRRYWTRRGIAQWLAAELREEPRTLVGIDHAFSFPLRYFEVHRLPRDWPAFLDDFQRHWPTDNDTFVDFVREGVDGDGAARAGDSRWRRLVDVRCRGKSPFHFDCPGSVAKSTHAGLPWLRYLRQRFGPKVHFWPFDGWIPPADRHVIAEIYPALWSRLYPAEQRNPHQHDAYSVARWMRDSDAAGTLTSYVEPALTAEERRVADVEGWILGLGGAAARQEAK